MSQDVATQEQFPGIKTMVQRLEIESSIETNDDGLGTDVASILESILAAGSVEDVFKAQELGTIASKDFLMRPFNLRSEDITWRRSTQGTFPFYALMRVTDLETGEQVTLNGGGITFVGIIYSLQNKGALDGDGMDLMLWEKSTQSGNSVVLVKPVVPAPKTRAASKA